MVVGVSNNKLLICKSKLIEQLERIGIAVLVTVIRPKAYRLLQNLLTTMKPADELVSKINLKLLVIGS